LKGVRNGFGACHAAGQPRGTVPPAHLQARQPLCPLPMEAACGQPAGRTNSGGWNSGDMALLERPIFAPLRETVHAGCARALREKKWAFRPSTSNCNPG
jgi:hypothetical protein